METETTQRRAERRPARTDEGHTLEQEYGLNDLHINFAPDHDVSITGLVGEAVDDESYTSTGGEGTTDR